MADSLVYPILYLSRHYLELVLKHLISLSDNILSKDLSDISHHNILKLWRSLKDNLESYNQVPREEVICKDDIVKLDNVFQQFHAIDQNSEVFRYSKTKKGTYSAKEGTRIELVYFGNIMKSISHYLEGLESVFLYDIEQMSN